ncbi:MAG: glucose-1-phosphate cytidylyltransferase [Gammaproteobacteria bacterium]|nr:glucose-1-phosphate cytidylyltransferase [Gammaproteobacteria bacterium]
MKAVILAGGFGTRISEESHLRPKPMIEIGEQPILWHIMKMYTSYGITDFVICAGYKQHMIKEYFRDYATRCSDMTFDFTNGGYVTSHRDDSEPWKVTVVDTGLNTMTGGRIKRISRHIGDETFCMTYGDGVSDVPLDKVVDFHKNHKKKATLTAVRPEGRFGMMDMDGDAITAFREKNAVDSGWINGGFMVLEPEVFDMIEGDSTIFERGPIEHLASDGELMAYRHDGFWQCMDTMRDKEKLQELWDSGKAPWKNW